MMGFSGGSYAEAAIDCWVVTTEQVIPTVAQYLRAHVSYANVTPWPPHVEELVAEETLDHLLKKFVDLLKK